MVIDTSSNLCSVAIKHNEERIYKTLDEGKTHSETLLPLINEVLEDNNISLDNINVLGVVIGPGSFTGIRIGISTIKAMAFAKDIPVITITSTEVLARNIVEESKYKIGIIDAKNDQIYAGVYSNDYLKITEFAGSIKDFIKVLKSLNINQNKKINGEIIKEEYSFSGSGIKYKDLIIEKLKDKNKSKNITCKFSDKIEQSIEKTLEGIEDKLKDKNNLIDGKILVPHYLKPSNAERKK